MRADPESSTGVSIEDLYRQRYDPLMRLAYLLTSRQKDAEDLVQAAFTALTESWDDVRSPKAYLRQTVINRASDLHRRNARSLPARPERVVGEPAIDDAWDLIQQLPDTQRTVVILRFYEDLPLVEIARLLDRPDNTVRSDLRRALQRLQKELDHG